VRVRLDRVRDAVADAESAVRGIADVASAQSRLQLHFNAARVFAEVIVRSADPLLAPERVAEQLKAALACLPAAERSAFWEDVVLADPAIARISHTPAVRAVAP
jgi:hypothetical protein